MDVGVKVLCEGKSVVGAEISGPALPRFTSGVAAARLVKEEALHKRHRQRECVKNCGFGYAIASQGVLGILYSQYTALLGYTIAILVAAQAPRHSTRKLPSIHVIQTARQRYCALAKLSWCRNSPLCTTCFIEMLVAVHLGVASEHCIAIPAIRCCSPPTPRSSGGYEAEVTCRGGAAKHDPEPRYAAICLQ